MVGRIEEIINIANHIPPFPKVASQVMKILDNPETQAKDLADVILYDSAITANLLKTCNAAYFGLPRKVSSLDEALVTVGHDILKDIIIASSSSRFYKGGEVGKGYQLEQGELWKHSVACAILAKMLSSYFKKVDAGVAFTVGLLHDIGKRFLSSFVADEFDKIITLVREKGITFMQAENLVLGMDHAELGAMIMEKWEFADEFCLAVRQHHDSDALDKSELTALLALSNTLVISLGIGTGADGMSGKMQGEGLKRFGITSMNLDEHLSDLVFELEKAEEMVALAD